MQGKYLVDHKTVTALRLSEFKLTPHDGIDAPFVVDGESMASGTVHVRVLPGKLNVFATPNEDIADAFKNSIMSMKSVTLKEAAKSPTLNEEDTVTSDEVQRLITRRGSFMGRRERKRMQRGKAADDDELCCKVSGAVEFITDEFDEIGTSSEEDDAGTKAMLGIDTGISSFDASNSSAETPAAMSAPAAPEAHGTNDGKQSPGNSPITTTISEDPEDNGAVEGALSSPHDRKRSPRKSQNYATFQRERTRVLEAVTVCGCVWVWVSGCVGMLTYKHSRLVVSVIHL